MAKAGDLKKALSKSAEVKMPRMGKASLSEKVQELRNDLLEALRKKGHLPKPKDGDTYAPGYVEAVFDDTVIFATDYDHLFAANYKVSKTGIELGAKTEVERRTIFVPKNP